jgi:hypothetical protein
MFGNKKKAVHQLPVVSIPPPRKKEFEVMFSLLNDAEKYDKADFPEVAASVLITLCECVERYKGIRNLNNDTVTVEIKSK